MANLQQAFLEYIGQFRFYKIILSVLLACMLMIISNGILHKIGIKDKRKLVSVALLIYLFLVFSTTVFAREKTGEVRYKLELFWSYRLAFFGQTKYSWEIVSNICMFLPIGLLVPAAMKFGKKDSYFGQTYFAGLFYTLFFGFFCSMMIELLQLVLRCGMFECDDIFNNVTGTLVGYLIFVGYTSICGKLQKSKNKEN